MASNLGNLGLFLDDIVPSGIVDGINKVFVLPELPNPVASLRMYVNGLLNKQGTDYTLEDVDVTFLCPPAAGSIITCWYRR